MCEQLYLGPRQHLLLLGFLLLAAMVAMAAPDAVLRLHYQCLLSKLTGIRCPFCGMTRDFILMSHGRRPVNNPGSVVVAVALYLVYPAWMLAQVLRTGDGLWIDRQKAMQFLGLGMVVLFICNNLWR